MSLHQSDLIQCHKQPGTTIGRLCSKCDGKCPTCESFITTPSNNNINGTSINIDNISMQSTSKSHAVRICDDCAFSGRSTKCVLCNNKVSGDGSGGGIGVYCDGCVLLERDRDGCCVILNVGGNRKDARWDRKNITGR
ncbi:hypothetical protein CANARDRAFT_30537 [[Candida] arabinofermentans NRRL YB-2248]|uniref:Uncharacterized protein n=1 Tax=[Candida] arabinofermentans NRRL YB-2248 TaxID=983967 RepID=A0A1E4STJ7_9ASCO|nr:hypothetical protein CANARDRAFT_30537 [[Candida] arabinofermentans NRRL YB-2248]